jgi:putative transposase
VAFIVDVYSRMNVGWQASRSLRTGLAIDAGDGDLQPGPHRQPRNLSLRYSQRLDQNDIVASVGSKGGLVTTTGSSRVSTGSTNGS